jgi:hypothetical protein
MIFGIVLLIALWLIYTLFVEGFLWKSILFFAGWFGIRYLLLAYAPSSVQTTLVFNHPITWAAVIASGVCFMCLLTTKND